MEPIAPSHKFPFRQIAMVILALLVTPNCTSATFAQGFSVESRSPSVVGAGEFVTLEGKFTIALPQRTHGFRPISIETANGRASGDAYNWKMKEASFIAGYVDLPQTPDGTDFHKQVFQNIRNGMAIWAKSQNGAIIDERQLVHGAYPALELKFEFGGRRLWQRYYLVSRRLYEVSAELSPEQRQHEDLALKALDSFRVLSDAEVAASSRARAAAAEPSPLPQEPVPSRLSSDARDDSLRGKVKTVYEEDEDRSGTWSVQGRKPNSMEYYNEIGNLTKRDLYDYKGNLFQITVYGYIDGARVSQEKTIQREYDPPPMMIASPPGNARPKSDPRYSIRFTFQYDDRKRLLEKTWFRSNGEVSIRYVYKYSGNEREELVYASDGSLNQRYLSILDEKGNRLEQTSFEPKDGSIRRKHSYTYEFDSKGNWIKRTTSKWVTKDGKSFYTPEYIDYRTITYY